MTKRTYTMGKEKIVDSWTALIENAAGRDQWVLDTIEQTIKDSNMQDILCYQAEVKSGFFRDPRNFLLVGHTSHQDYHLFICARDVGIHLDVAWYLTFAPDLLKRLFVRFSPRNLQAWATRINLFDRQDLSGFVSVVHHCVMNTTKMLYEELSLDSTGMNTKSNGFLSVW
jgi:hypothetical protein